MQRQPFFWSFRASLSPGAPPSSFSPDDLRSRPPLEAPHQAAATRDLPRGEQNTRVRIIDSPSHTLRNRWTAKFVVGRGASRPELPPTCQSPSHDSICAPKIPCSTPDHTSSLPAISSEQPISTAVGFRTPPPESSLTQDKLCLSQAVGVEFFFLLQHPSASCHDHNRHHGTDF